LQVKWLIPFLRLYCVFLKMSPTFFISENGNFLLWSFIFTYLIASIWRLIADITILCPLAITIAILNYSLLSFYIDFSYGFSDTRQINFFPSFRSFFIAALSTPFIFRYDVTLELSNFICFWTWMELILLLFISFNLTQLIW